MKTGEAIKIFLLGMIVALLGVIAFRPQEQGAAYADDGSAAGGLIAVTGEEKSTLYLIDPAKKVICQYSTDNARFTLRGARYYKNDHGLYDDNKAGGGIPVKEAKKLAEKWAKKPPE